MIVWVSVEGSDMDGDSQYVRGVFSSSHAAKAIYAEHTDWHWVGDETGGYVNSQYPKFLFTDPEVNLDPYEVEGTNKCPFHLDAPYKTITVSIDGDTQDIEITERLWDDAVRRVEMVGGGHDPFVVIAASILGTSYGGFIPRHYWTDEGAEHTTAILDNDGEID